MIPIKIKKSKIISHSLVRLVPSTSSGHPSSMIRYHMPTVLIHSKTRSRPWMVILRLYHHLLDSQREKERKRVEECKGYEPLPLDLFVHEVRIEMLWQVRVIVSLMRLCQSELKIASRKSIEKNFISFKSLFNKNTDLVVNPW